MSVKNNLGNGLGKDVEMQAGALEEEDDVCPKCQLRIRTQIFKPSNTSFKLMEQTHCASCWRPLRVSTLWPGPRPGSLPPDPKCSTLEVAQCGHVYHSCCSRVRSHCSACQAYIKTVRPLEIEIGSGCQCQVDETVQTDEVVKEADGSKVVESCSDSKLSRKVQKLHGKLDEICKEISEIRRNYTAEKYRDSGEISS